MRILLTVGAFAGLMLAAALSDGTVRTAAPPPRSVETDRPLVAPLAPPLASPLVVQAIVAPLARPAPPTLHETEARVRALRARGAGEDEVYRVRAQALPARTVAELMEREQAERAWEERLTAYRAGRAQQLNEAEREQLRAYEKPVPRLQ